MEMIIAKTIPSDTQNYCLRKVSLNLLYLKNYEFHFNLWQKSFFPGDFEGTNSLKITKIEFSVNCFRKNFVSEVTCNPAFLDLICNTLLETLHNEIALAQLGCQFPRPVGQKTNLCPQRNRTHLKIDDEVGSMFRSCVCKCA